MTTPEHEQKCLFLKSPAYLDEIFKILKGTTINFAGYLSWQLLGLLYVFLLARLLDTNDLGLYYLGIAIINLAGVLCLGGTDIGVQRFISIYHGLNNLLGMKNTLISSFLIIIFLSVGISLSIFLTSDLIAQIFSKVPLSYVLKILSLYLPFFAIMSICLSTTQAMKHMKYKVYCQDISNNLLKIILLLLFYYLGFRLLGAVLAYVISIIIVALLSIYFLKKIFPQDKCKRSISHELKQLLSFSIPQTFSSVIYKINTMTDTLMLGYLVVASSVGIYSVALKIVLAGTCILTSFNTMFSPMIADLHNQGQHQKLNSLYKNVTKWILTLSLPIYIFMIFFSQQILAIFGRDFLAGSTSLIILCAGQIINSGTGPAGMMLIMSGHTYITLANNLIIMVLNISLNAILIPRYGILGAALATSSSMAFVNIVRVIQVYFLMKVHPYEKTYLKPTFACFGSIALALLAFKTVFANESPLSLVGVCILFSSAYMACLALLRPDDTDRLILKKVRELISTIR